MSKGLQYSGHSYPHWLKKVTISSGFPQKASSPRLMMAILLNTWRAHTHTHVTGELMRSHTHTQVDYHKHQRRNRVCVCFPSGEKQKPTLKSSERGWWMVTMTILFLLASSASSTTI